MIICLIGIALLIIGFIIISVYIFKNDEIPQVAGYATCFVAIILGCSLGICLLENTPGNIKDARQEYQEKIESFDNEYNYLKYNPLNLSSDELNEKIETYNRKANDFIHTLKSNIDNRKNPWISWFICCFYTEKNIDLSKIQTFAVSYVR